MKLLYLFPFLVHSLNSVKHIYVRKHILQADAGWFLIEVLENSIDSNECGKLIIKIHLYGTFYKD